MDSKDHGSNIITRLRLICEEMYNERHNMSAAAGLRSQAENILPLAEVDDIEVIILREASAIANARGDNALAERLETLRYFIADEQATPTRGMGGGPINPDNTGRTLRRVVAASNAAPWEQEATEMMNLVISRPSDHHVQLRDADSGKVFADWWPSRGTTRKDGKMGPTCRTGEDLIAWLRSIG